MASYYKRPNSKYLWVKWTDPATSKVIRSSTASIIRANGEITPCLDNREGEKVAEKICREIEAMHNLNLALSPYSVEPEKSASLNFAFNHFKQNNINKNPQTIQEYERFFKLFTSTFSENLPCSEVDKLKCESWLLQIQTLKFFQKKGTETVSRKYSQNTLYGYQKVLKKFLNFLFEYDYVRPFKLNKDIQVSMEAGKKTIFSADDINIIMENLNTASANLRLSLYMLCYTGLRSTDILNINVQDINLTQGKLCYYSQKLNEHREIPISDKLVKILSDQQLPATGKLITYTDHRILNRQFQKYLKKLQLSGKDYTARTFRKSFVSWSYELGMDIVASSRLVGHGINTAEKHYREVNLSTLKKQVNKFDIPKVDVP